VYVPLHAGEKKYNSDIYERLIDLFKHLPLCALVDGKYFAVHGGLSPFVKTLSTREWT
jgi:diadenosine tetraphosphatase ApaH/serine/threonine PP2A family protein phosphatase